jgi:hypothetical protein
LGGICTEGKIINIKMGLLRTQGVRMWTGFIRLRIWFISGLL